MYILYVCVEGKMPPKKVVLIIMLQFYKRYKRRVKIFLLCWGRLCLIYN